MHMYVEVLVCMYVNVCVCMSENMCVHVCDAEFLKCPVMGMLFFVL